MPASRQRDDTILPLTRWTSALVTPVLLAAGIILYGAPNRTEDLWAWTVRPEPTALAVGGGYLAGAVFFLRATRSSAWHRLRVGIFGAAVLSALLLLTTVLHWDRFNHDHPSFWAWFGLYLITPVLLPVLLVTNDRHDPGPTPGDVTVPGWVRAALAAAGVVQLAVAGFMFATPSRFAEVWAWDLTPLTTRTLSAFLSFVGVLWLAFLVESRWSALELPVHSAWLGLALVALGALRSRDDLDDGPSTLGFAVILVAMLAGVAALAVLMRSRTPTGGVEPD